MSDDEESSGMASHSLQEFQTLVLPPVPRPTNNNQQHHHPTPTTLRRIQGTTAMNPSNLQARQTTSLHHGHHQSSGSSSSHHHHHGAAGGHHTQHSIASEPYPTSKPSSSNKGGVRGRVTVVCAEVSSDSFSNQLIPLFSLT